MAATLNPANVVTVLRIALVPLLVLLLLDLEHAAWPAALLLVALSLSDALDGHLARSRGEVTTLGKLLDPLADKLLVGAALLALVAIDRLALAVALVILGREALVSWLRMLAKQQHGVVISASPLGKVKTTLQLVMMVALVVAPDPGATWIDALVAVTVAMTLISGVDYALSFRRDVGRATRAATT